MQVATLFYAKTRQDAGPFSRQLESTSTSWSDPEIARIVEIMIDLALQSQILLLHQPAERGEIDGAFVGSINETIWANTVQRNFNDHIGYVPPFRFPDDANLQSFNTNDSSIPRRGADLCKNQWAGIRSEFTLTYARWAQSGQMDPDTFPNFVNNNM